MASTIPLSRLSTNASSPLMSSHHSPEEGDYPDGLPYNADDPLHAAPSWKRDLYLLLEKPTSSQAAFLIHFFTTALIVISAVVTVLETVPAFHSISGGVWFGLETTLVVLFTIEYIGRCIAHGTSWKRFFNWVICECLHPVVAMPVPKGSAAFFGIIDLLGILPYYIEIILQQDTVSPYSFHPRGSSKPCGTVYALQVYNPAYF